MCSPSGASVLCSGVHVGFHHSFVKEEIWLHLLLRLNSMSITLVTNVSPCVVSTWGDNNLKFAASQTSYMIIPHPSILTSHFGPPW